MVWGKVAKRGVDNFNLYRLCKINLMYYNVYIMIGGTPTQRGPESPASKKAQAIVYIRPRLEQERARLEILAAQANYYKTHESQPGSTYEKDQKDYFTSPEVLEELRHLQDFVDRLESDITLIEGGNQQATDRYLEELQKLPTK